MKICHVLEAAGGGVGQVVIDLATAKAFQQDEITVIYSEKRVEKKFLDEISALGSVRKIICPMWRQIGLHDIYSLLKLWVVIKQNGPFDIIHAHSSKAGALCRILQAMWPLGSKIIYTPHAYATLGPKKNPIILWAEKILAAYCDHTITVSKYEYEHARKVIGVKSETVSVIPNGIRDVVNGTTARSSEWHTSQTTLPNMIEKMAVRTELGLNASDFVIGFVGRLTPQKSPLFAAEIFKRLVQQQSQNSHFKYVLLGSGPQAEAVQHLLLNEISNKKALFFTNKTGRELMPAFDILLCTSAFEGFPIVFLEALFAGVPIITTNVGGASESILPNETGWIVDQLDDIETFVKLINDYHHKSSDEKNDVRQKCLAHAEKFNFETTAANTRKLYARLLRNNYVEIVKHVA